MGKLTAKLNSRVAAYRIERKLTQEQLARAANVSRQTIIAIEGEMYNPSTILALRLSFFLDVSVNELFFFSEGDVAKLQDNRTQLYSINESEQESSEKGKGKTQ